MIVYKQLDMVRKNTLSISSWNIHGLGDKINDPLFIQKISSDINILLETWKGDTSKNKITGYNYISKSRKKRKNAKRNSGGIIVYIRKEVFKGIEYLKNATISENRLWMKLDKDFFEFSHNIYICATYIPPNFSKHYDNDFMSLGEEISSFSDKGKIILIGDMNARIGNKLDYIENDTPEINNFDGVDLLPPDYEIDIPLRRVSQDKVINNHGNNLLDVCLSSGLRILNGRFLGDSLGYYTFMSQNGFSSVDYAIASQSLLPSVKFFKTDSFGYLSDHVQIELYIKCSYTSENKVILDRNKWKEIKTYKWETTSVSENLITEALSQEKIRNDIINFETNDINMTQDGVDEATSKLSNILYEISNISCKSIVRRKRKKRKKIFL